MKRALLLMLALLLAPTARAAGRLDERLVASQQVIENQVTALVRLYDPKALSFVHVVVPRVAKALPGTPFYYKDYEVNTTEERIIQRIDVQIVSDLAEIPSELGKLIEHALVSYGCPVRLELRHATGAGNPIDTAKQKNTTSPTSFTGPESWVFYGLCALTGFALVLVFGLLGTGWILRGGSREVAETLRGSLGALQETLREGGGLGGAKTAATATATPTLERGGRSTFADFGAETCLALLADCYWCERDEYAAFLWAEMSVAQRREVQLRWAPLAQYARSISRQSGRDLGLHLDVSYLRPLPVHHLNNESLAKQVKATPALFRSLSPMRIAALPLGVKERMDLMARPEANVPESAEASLTQLAPSSLRPLASQLRITLVNEQEEQEAQGMTGASLAVKEQLVTLAWIAQLSREEIADVLSAFSARELASAWIGPPRLLELLAASLPAKKRELLESYRQTLAPSRDSDAYRRLHAATIVRLRGKDMPRERAYAKAA